ncbi:hypothetical protein TWF730_003025 [Orbilia blumenaviensis]|uniref:NADH:ubiquinone oxidoreductase intermediate-associated protein 30 domain-containing protein n=1 Tax=Orbilia blumenaviensis TaxID=1796055 RepID=A0AAV9UC81_9PEZI
MNTHMHNKTPGYFQRYLESMSIPNESSNATRKNNVDTTVPLKGTTVDLFGGEKEWESKSWTASDDRVRGGRSQSYFEISEDRSTATFHGNLDITALGGAGFASQRTTDAAGGPWDLSKADGISIQLGDIDDRIYTFVLKDTVLPKRSDGREQSTVSYEFSFSIVNTTINESDGNGALHTWEACFPADFSAAEQPYALLLPYEADTGDDSHPPASITIYVPWHAFHPFYRGKKKPEDDQLDKTDIKRLSIMCRSMFGKQFGHFSLGVKSISTFSAPKIYSLLPGTSFMRLRASSSTETSPGTYILPKPLLKDTVRTSKSSQPSDLDLVQSLDRLDIDAKK